MDALTVTTIGSYPRPPREGGEFRLRKAMNAVDRGEATADDVRGAEDDLTREILAEQAAAGVELVTDGQVRWVDSLSHFADGLEGCVSSGLLRYYDTNTYFRQLVVKGPVRRDMPIVVDEFRFAAENSAVPVKAVLTGPYTLTALALDEHYGGNRRALARGFATALNQEARDLAAAGAKVIQFDEPSLARVPGSPPGDLSVLAEVADALLAGIDVTTVITTYFGDVAPLGPAFFRLPFDVFGLDFVAGPANYDLLTDFPDDKGLQAGIVDARNTKLEEAAEIVVTIGRIGARVPRDRLWVAPSCGLEFLPRETAEAKLRRLAEAKERLS